MTQKPPLITLTAEQRISWYQHHVCVLHGYALALALKAGLSPEEAASFFVEPWHSARASQASQATDQMLEQQARQAAEVLALTYGAEHVQVEHQGETWLVKAIIVDCEPLERYGASLELHARWTAEQLRQVCEPKGILCSTWLARDTQHLQFSLRVSE